MSQAPDTRHRQRATGSFMKPEDAPDDSPTGSGGVRSVSPLALSPLSSDDDSESGNEGNTEGEAETVDAVDGSGSCSCATSPRPDVPSGEDSSAAPVASAAAAADSPPEEPPGRHHQRSPSSFSARFFRPRSPSSHPHASSDVGREWETWLTELQNEISLLRKLDPDKLFTTKASDMRVRVAAHVIQMKQKLDDSYQKGVRNLHEEITELAERAGFHFKFFSVAYMSRLAFSLSLLFVSAYICSLASMVCGYRTPHVVLLDLDLRPIQGAHTLPDLGHDLWAWLLVKGLHYHTDYIDVYSIPDRIAGMLTSVTFAFVLLHPRRFLIMRRVAIVFAILFLFRAFTVTVTSLPDASPTCLAQFYDPEGSGRYKREPMFPRVLVRAFQFLVNPSAHVTCGDTIFSGHTTVLMMCSMIFFKYCRGRLLRTKVFFRSFHVSDGFCRLVRRTVYLVTGVGALLIIGTRLHYTLDVAIALYITQRTFLFFHDCIKYPRMGRKQAVYTLLRWLEEESVLAVDMEAYQLVKTKA